MTKSTRACLALATASLLGGVQATQAVSFDFAALNGASIYFDGSSHFEFLANGSGHSFEITNGSAAGIDGHITGTFTIGAVVTIAGVSTAPVSGVGTFIVADGGTPLTADVEWDAVVQAGVGSTLNFTGTVNLTNISYSGTNADLAELNDDGAGINTVTFQFTRTISLSALKTTETQTSFSGSVASVNVPDGGSSALLLGLAFLGVGAVARRRQ